MPGIMNPNGDGAGAGATGAGAGVKEGAAGVEGVDLTGGGALGEDADFV
jgi:hypothetical protein